MKTLIVKTIVMRGKTFNYEWHPIKQGEADALAAFAEALGFDKFLIV